MILLSLLLGLCWSRIEGNTKEYGKAELEIIKTNTLFKNLGKRETVWMSHGDSVSKMPEGFENIGKTQDCEYAAIADFDRKFYGLQFHPEVENTPHGINILRNFVYKISGAKQTWTMENFIDSKVSEIKNEIKDRDVLLLISGGESVVLRPVYSERAMTASFADLPIDFVRGLAREIMKLGVGAVFYDVTNKPPGTIEWE